MSSTGMTDVDGLIQSMQPTLQGGTFVFGHVPAKSDADSANVMRLFTSIPVQMMFRESEGWTVIVEQSVAESIQLQSIFPCKKITLNVHSSLDAVGFLAVIQTELAKSGVGVNPVSGYFHDHLFVPFGKEEIVLEALQKMAAEKQD